MHLALQDGHEPMGARSGKSCFQRDMLGCQVDKEVELWYLVLTVHLTGTRTTMEINLCVCLGGCV